MQIDHDKLARFTARIFTSAGATAPVAEEVADHLVTANLKGHDSHGVGMIPSYVSNIANGHLRTDAHAEVIRDQGAVLMIDGGTGFGQVVGREAVDIALQRVKETGVVSMYRPHMASSLRHRTPAGQRPPRPSAPKTRPVSA